MIQPKVLALLQNTWVRDPERTRNLFIKHPGKRPDIIARLLFSGSVTGRRLQDTFGDWCDRFVWEEASPEITGRPDVRIRGDVEHVRRALEQHAPAVVVTFGVVARDTLRQAGWTGPLVSAPHPACRSYNRNVLVTARQQLEQIVETLT